MSHDSFTLAVVKKIVTAADGALLGIGLAYGAYCNIRKYAATSSALQKIRDAPSVLPSDLRCILADGDSEKFVVVRGRIEAAAEAEGISLEAIRGEKGVMVQTIQTVPFILVEGGKQPESDYLVVNMEGSKHPLPLISVYKDYPLTNDTSVMMRYKQKILPCGKDITALGICSSKNGTFEIKSCKDLPCFLTFTKDELLVGLNLDTKAHMWIALLVGTIAIGIIGYSATRNWTKWTQNSSTSDATDDDEGGPAGLQCLMCRNREWKFVFLPCGHVVCDVGKSHSPPICGFCGQTITSCSRIYSITLESIRDVCRISSRD